MVWRLASVPDAARKRQVEEMERGEELCDVETCGADSIRETSCLGRVVPEDG